MAPNYKVVSIFEQLNEGVSFDFLAKATEKVLILDFSNFRIMDSTVINDWVDCLDKSNAEVIYRNCPSLLTWQFFMIPELLRNKAYIESFKIPYICYECDHEDDLLINTKKDIKDLQNFDPEKIKPLLCPNCSTDMEVDFSEIETYDFLIDMSKEPEIQE